MWQSCSFAQLSSTGSKSTPFFFYKVGPQFCYMRKVIHIEKLGSELRGSRGGLEIFWQIFFWLILTPWSSIGQTSSFLTWCGGNLGNPISYAWKLNHIGWGSYSLVTCIRSEFFLNILSYTHDIKIFIKKSQLSKIYCSIDSVQVIKGKHRSNVSDQTLDKGKQ